MTLRHTAILAAAGLVWACSSGEQVEQNGMAESAAETATPEAALEKLRADYETHFNLHHADMVAGLFTDSAVFLAADGSVMGGKPAIQQQLTDQFATSPTLSTTTVETRPFGNYAVGRGTYTITMTPEGASPIDLAGNYMTLSENVADGWKLDLVLTNYSAPPPEGLPAPTPPTMQPEEHGTLQSVADDWSKHFNLGHPDMVADFYADDAVASFSDEPASNGKAAIQASLAALLAQGKPQVKVHDVGTTDLGNGWMADGGWYEMTVTTEAGPQKRQGTYMILAHRNEDGTVKIQWHYSNNRLPAM
jgi:uncharacterized protein (TIGR02246 family)